ncbi:unnamed protein product, partial [Rotaria socialis]
MKECKWQTWSELYENDRSIAIGWSIHENVELLMFWSKQTEKYIHLPMPTNSIVAILLSLF